MSLRYNMVPWIGHGTGKAPSEKSGQACMTAMNVNFLILITVPWLCKM